MKPPSFEYHVPTTLGDALALAGEYGDDARVIAGGQSLVPMMNMRLARPDHVIDINGIDGLSYVRADTAVVEIGALTPHSDVERSAELARRCPLLPAAARNIGHYALRQRGTMGGSLALADPAAELPMMAMLLDGEMEARSARQTRRIAAADFFVSVYTTALEPGEIVTAARFRALGEREGWGLRWLSRRAGDYAIVNAAATLGLDAIGRIDRIALALGGVGATPLRLTVLEQRAVGQAPAPDWARDIAAKAAASIEPESDRNASAAYRRELVAVLLRRALDDALARAKGEEPA